MITLKELNPKNFKTTPEIDQNLQTLLAKLNEFRKIWGKPMIITSGLRDMEDHKRIYKNKGIADESKIPMRSRHLFGLAADISDPKGELHAWCKNNAKVLEDLGFWCEERQGNWQHLQIVPYGSFKLGGSRWFNP